MARALPLANDTGAVAAPVTVLDLEYATAGAVFMWHNEA